MKSPPITTTDTTCLHIEIEHPMTARAHSGGTSTTHLRSMHASADGPHFASSSITAAAA